MKIGYADLSIRPADDDVALRMIKLASRLGYKILAVEYRDNLDMGRLASVARGEGVRIVTRVTVRGATRSDIRVALDRVWDLVGGKALVVVEAESIDVARYAGVNKRVHVLRVKPGTEVFIDKSQERLFRSRGWGAFEIPLSYVSRGASIGYLYEVVDRVRRLNVRAIAVSDAVDEYTMWSPVSIIGLLHTLGLRPEQAASWVSSSPASIVSMAIGDISV
jgi:RNase P/RNase MRP subunit p30